MPVTCIVVNMKLTPAWRNRLRNLTTIFLVLTIAAIIYTFVLWIRSEPGSFEPLNALFFAIFPFLSALSAWLTRPDNVQPPASSEIAVEETPALGPLRQQITSLFNLDEIRVLCLDLGMNYDDLSGSTISTKAASMIAYADRRGQLDQLMVALQRERPSANWPLPNTLQRHYTLRRNVRATWIKGVLKQSVTDEIALELKLTLQPHTLTRKVMYVPGQDGALVEKDIPTLFAEYGSLLILGEPGSGKTMTLLQLAEFLLDEAEHNTQLTTPVILNLSSWATNQTNFTEWLIEELLLQYQLPRNIGKELVQYNRLSYLLDGLDEVAEEARSSCVKSINDFQASHVVSIAVCSRVSEYEASEAKLNLGMAVQILPLKKDQVVEYLQRPEIGLQNLYQLWQMDEVFEELTQSLLFLSVITFAFRGKESSRGYFNTNITQQNWQTYLYQYYVSRMFEHRPLKKFGDYDEQQAVHWLTNLAYGMKSNDLSVFYIERLQPTWLKELNLNFRFSWVSGAVFGLIISLVCTVGISLLGGVRDGLTAGLVVGLLVAVIVSRDTARRSIGLFEELIWSPPPSKELFNEVKRGLGFGLAGGLGGGILGGVVGILTGLQNGVLNVLPGSSIGFGLIVGAIFGLSVGLGNGFNACIGVRENTQPPIPNLGIRNSFFSSVRMSVIYGLIFGLIFGTLGWFVALLSEGSQLFALLFGITLGGVGGIFGGMFSGLILYGGQTVIRHYTLRWLLASRNVLPFPFHDKELIQFLDEMKDRVFLRRVGGGWVFMHRTLLDYFASLHPNAQVEVDDE